MATPHQAEGIPLGPQRRKTIHIQISYFSGTGCTEHVAQTISSEFQSRGHEVSLKNLVKDPSLEEQTEILVVCFVVHACNAPKPVMDWVKHLKKSKTNPRAVVVSVSGGGEVTPNLACRVPIKRALRRKKFLVVYEKMLVMPSNWIVETAPILSAQLLQVLPEKISFMVHGLLMGRRHFTFPGLGNRLLTL